MGIRKQQSVYNIKYTEFNLTGNSKHYYLYPYLASICLVVLILSDRFHTFSDTAAKYFWNFPAALIFIPTKDMPDTLLSNWSYLAVCCISIFILWKFVTGIPKHKASTKVNIFWRQIGVITTMVVLTTSSFAAIFFSLSFLIALHFVAMLVLLIQCWFWGVICSRNENYLNYRIKPLKIWIALGVIFWYLIIIMNILQNNFFKISCSNHTHGCAHFFWSLHNIQYLSFLLLHWNIDKQLLISFSLQVIFQLTTYIFLFYVAIIIFMMYYKRRYSSLSNYGKFFLILIALEAIFELLAYFRMVPGYLQLIRTAFAIFLFITWVDLLFYVYNISNTPISRK